MERAIIFTLRLLNSGASLAARPSSVVQTGVKSRGWEKRMPHLKEESRGRREDKAIGSENQAHRFTPPRPTSGCEPSRLGSARRPPPPGAAFCRARR